MTTEHTSGLWEITWYECRADAEDVAAGTAKKVGDLLWRVPKQIGPLSVDKNHWAGEHLDVSEADARLISASALLLQSLQEILPLAELWVREHGPWVRSTERSPCEKVQDAAKVLALVKG